METGVGGLIQGISLGAFLQMVQMERKTCTLTIRSDEGIGRLYILNGDLIAAETDTQRNKEAAYEIIGWDQTLIEIDDTCPKRKKEINQPLMHLLMEGLKAKDEQGRKKDSAGKKKAQGQKKKSIKIATAASQDDADLAPDISVEEEIGELALEDDSVEAAVTPARIATDGSPPPSPVHSDEVPLTQVEDLPLPQGKPAGGTEAETLKQSREILAEKRKEADELARKTLPQREAAAKAAREQKKKRIKNISIAAAAAVVVLLIAVLLIQKITASRIQSRYDDLVTSVSASTALVEKEDKLLHFLETYPSHPRIADVESRLNKVRDAIEKQDFENVQKRVHALPVDTDFEQKAGDIYRSFLTGHAGSKYVAQVKAELEKLPALVEELAFEKLVALEGMEDAVRIEEYSLFINRFPDGAHRAEVEEKIAKISDAYHAFILREITKCNQAKAWQTCIRHCDEFIGLFKGTRGARDLAKQRVKLQDHQDLADLDKAARGLDHNPAAALDLYRPYLAKHPGTSEAKAIRTRIEALEKNIKEQQAWESVAAFARNEGQDIGNRIRRVRSYMDDTASNRYMADARQLLAQLDQERQTGNRRISAKKSQEREQQQKERRLRQQRRLQQLTAAATIRINNRGAGRFRADADGTVKDAKTGLTWTALDSKEALGKCIDHPTASAYVRSLRTGGFSDWRLPLASDLVVIYKNKPFFPSEDIRWYWTSDLFTKGYHKISDVVTSKPETSWKRQQERLDRCGSVRAVRP